MISRNFIYLVAILKIQFHKINHKEILKSTLPICESLVFVTVVLLGFVLAVHILIQC